MFRYRNALARQRCLPCSCLIERLALSEEQREKERSTLRRLSASRAASASRRDVNSAFKGPESSSLASTRAVNLIGSTPQHPSTHSPRRLRGNRFRVYPCGRAEQLQERTANLGGADRAGSGYSPGRRPSHRQGGDHGRLQVKRSLEAGRGCTQSCPQRCGAHAFELMDRAETKELRLHSPHNQPTAMSSSL